MIRKLDDIIGSMSDDVQEALTGDKKKASHDASDAESCSAIDDNDEVEGDSEPKVGLMGDIVPDYLNKHDGGDGEEEELDLGLEEKPDTDVEVDYIGDDKVVGTDEEQPDDDDMRQPPFRTAGVIPPSTSFSWLADKFRRKPRDGRSDGNDDDFDV